MSCYHPLYGKFEGFSSHYKRQYRIVHNPAKLEEVLEHEDDILIPCGKCLGCRLDYSRRWADRMMLEYDACDKKAVFVTLTYDQEHIVWSNFDEFGCPINGTLVKRDFQLFMKRLRKHFTGKEIRFYAAGEYGERTLRPHYHAILFGLSLADFGDLQKIGQNGRGEAYWNSPTLFDIWQNGYVLLASCSWNTFAYVARYVTKKAQSDLQLYYDSCGMLPEFSLMSRRPGIGKPYLEKHPDCLDFSKISLSTEDGGRDIRIPKYFLRELEKSDPVRYNELMDQRAAAASDSLYLKNLKTDMEYLEYLELEEERHYKRIKGLPRNVL